MVFQHFNLFPHLTILENCTLAPIWVRKMPKKEAEEVAMRYLDARQDPRAGEQISGPALRRPAAARRHRAGAVHEPEHHAVRRADVGARPGDDQGSARRDGRPGRGRHDHDRASPTRWGSPGRWQTGSSSWMPARSSSRTSRSSSSPIRSTSGPSFSSARSCTRRTADLATRRLPSFAAQAFRAASVAWSVPKSAITPLLQGSMKGSASLLGSARMKGAPWAIKLKANVPGEPIELTGAPSQHWATTE